MNQNGEILIISDHLDAHVDTMILTMQELGIEPIRLNYNDIPTNVLLNRSFDHQNLNRIELKTNGKTIELSKLKSVWWRKPFDFHPMTEITPDERVFVQKELQQFMHGLWTSTDCFWISRPDAITQASRKPEQLQRALRYGFRIPKTLISNDVTQIRDFYKTCQGNMIFKVLTDPFVFIDIEDKTGENSELANKVTRTTMITPEILDTLESTFLGIGQFQEYTEKKTEIRATVIGNAIFCAEIHSQVEESTRIDWRNYAVDIPYTEHHLPADLAKKCIDFVRSYGLEFGAIDFILTPENEYVFLENNPNGQFMFIEHKVPSLKMTHAVIEALVKGHAVTL